VLAGLFRVIETLFGVDIEAGHAPVWHEDVRFFRIESRKGELIGQFYLDLYARETKRGGAWMDDAITPPQAYRRRHPDAGGLPQLQLPGPVGGKPATFTHDDVITLFHETGHGLHHLLTRVEELACPASTASNGMPSNCPASSWRTSAGNGTCCRT
jgi:oligopeptidase A